MGIFSKPQSTQAGNSVAPATPVKGVPLYLGTSTSLATTTTPLNVQPISNFNGLPLTALYIQLAVTDTTSTTVPSGVNSVESTIYEFKLIGQSGAIIMDMYGDRQHFENWQHLINPHGYYTTAPTPADSSASTAYTVNYNFVLAKPIPASEFPLMPTVTLNTLSSRATTLNSMTATATLNVYGDFTPAQFTRTKLKYVPIANSTTGVFNVSPYMDKGVVIKQQAYFINADANFGTNTINFATNGQQIRNNTPYQSIISQEDAVFPITTPHIAGLFPLFTEPFASNFSTNLTLNFASAPDVVSHTDVFDAYFEEVY
jgi:hypothetical protein